MDKTIRKFSNFEELKAEEYRYWQSRPVHERWAATEELSLLAYALKHRKLPRAQNPWVRLPNPLRSKS